MSKEHQSIIKDDSLRNYSTFEIPDNSTTPPLHAGYICLVCSPDPKLHDLQQLFLSRLSGATCEEVLIPTSDVTVLVVSMSFETLAQSADDFRLGMPLKGFKVVSVFDALNSLILSDFELNNFVWLKCRGGLPLECNFYSNCNKKFSVLRKHLHNSTY